MNSTINIAFGFDNNYAQHTLVTICSILENNNSKRKYHFYLFSPELLDEHLNNLSSFILSYNQKYSIIDFNEIKYKEFKFNISKKYNTIPNISALYLKILFEDYMPINIDKIISLDSDMIILSDLSELYDTNLNNFIIGGVCEDISKNHLKQLSFIKNKDSYFNAGLLLIDLKQWREKDIGNKLIELSLNKKHKYSLYDQDVLNTYFRNNFLHLDKKFNQLAYMFNLLPIISKINLKYKSINGDIGYQGIIHFTGSKPWKHECLHPYKNLYFKYLAKTPYRDYLVIEDKHARFIALVNANYLTKKIFRLFTKLMKIFK